MADRLESISDYRVVECDAPAPGPGEVCIRVTACGVGFVDALVALGRYQVKPPLPHTPGTEIVGEIAALDGAVTGIAKGARVIARVSGGFTEFVVAPAASVIEMPEALTDAQGAVLYVNYITAMHALKDRAYLAEGQRLLVLGAAGGVGAAAVQVGAMLGARIIAAASTDEKRAFARSIGAHDVLDTDPAGWRERLKAVCGGKGPDVVFDPVCGALFEPAFRSLAWGGRHLVVGFAGGGIPALPANLPLLKGAGLIGVDARQFIEYQPVDARAHLQALVAAASRDEFTPPVGREFAFDDYAAALEFAQSGAGRGKTVLRVAAPP